MFDIRKQEVNEVSIKLFIETKGTCFINNGDESFHTLADKINKNTLHK